MQVDKKIELILEELSKFSSNPSHLIYTNKELLQVLDISDKTLQKWRDQGTIGYRQVGRQFFYTHTDVMDMMDRHHKPPIK